jgi:hypothetical protein
MSKGNFLRKVCFAVLTASVILMTACSRDDDKPTKDPAGTVEFDLGSEKPNILALCLSQSCNNICWKSPDNLAMTGGRERRIYDMGKMDGLGAIRTIPKWNNEIDEDDLPTNVPCIVGHGYIFRYVAARNPDKWEYLRMYVLAPIVDDFGNTTGVKVKYQYPFVQ